MTTSKEAQVSLHSPQSLIKFATELKTFIIKQKLFTNIQGKNYVNVEGWQFAGGNLGLLPVVESCTRLDRKDEIIYQASVALFNGNKIVSRGIAVCSSKEKGKSTKEEYVIASMAQTRAEGKAYRLILGWLMKVAGYETTPTEEVSQEAIKKEQVAETPTAEKAPVDYVGQVRKHLFKLGATDEKSALALLKSKTGLIWKNFNSVSPTAAQRALAELLRR